VTRKKLRKKYKIWKKKNAPRARMLNS
jgi:hypothetical protein